MAKLHEQGVPIRRIARRLGMARNVVRRWLRAGEAAPYRRAPGRSVLDQHLGQMERRWAEGCRNAAELWRELREERGFEGGYDVVRRWTIRRRGLHQACTWAAVLTRALQPVRRAPADDGKGVAEPR